MVEERTPDQQAPQEPFAPGDEAKAAPAAETPTAPDVELANEEETREELQRAAAEEAAYRERIGAATAVTVATNNVAPKQKKAGLGRFIATILIAGIVGGAAGAGVSMQLIHTYYNQALPASQTAEPGHAGSKAITLSATGDMAIPDIAEAVIPTVVGITNTGTVTDWFGRRVTTPIGAGSGVIVQDDGYIVTNYHVIKGATSLAVTLHDGTSYDATIVGADASADIAVIKIDATDLPAATFGDSDQLRVGELAVAIGNPLDASFSQSVTDGIISGTNRQLEMENQTLGLIQTNAAINAGNSGGALVNGQAELIGINTIKISATGVEGIGFAIPANDVKHIADQLIEKGAVSKPFIGIAGYSINAAIQSEFKLSVDKGIYIATVIADGPSAQAGIQQGDIITHVNGTALSGFNELAQHLRKMKVGDQLTLTVLRDGAALNIVVLLGEQSGVE